MILHHNEPPDLFLGPDGIMWLEKDETGALVARKMNKDRLRYYVTDKFDFTTSTGKDKDTRHARPPEDLVPNILARRDKTQLPRLRGLVRIPQAGPDGEVRLAGGYDKETCMYFDPGGLTLPWPVSDYPSRRRSSTAIFYINDRIDDFPFVGDAERAHAIAAMIQPFIRPMIDGPTPLYLIEKPTSGTGATLLAHVLSYPALGDWPSAVTQPKDESEWRRATLSWLRDSPQVIIIDNLGTSLASSNLASVLTATKYTDRIIGSSDAITVPVDAMWIATGNNPGLNSEMARRSVRIRIDAQSERPDEGRIFKYPDLRQEVMDTRPVIVWAILTLVVGWVRRGSKGGGDLSVMGMFDNWARILGGILDMAGVKGFLTNRSEQRILSDTDNQMYTALKDRWLEKFRLDPIESKELFHTCEEVGIYLGPGTDHARRVRLGKILSSLRDRIFGSHRVETAGYRHKQQTYRLVEVGDMQKIVSP